VAARLNVAFVLEGSVRKSGDRVRITALLIEARSDTHLRSETYDRTLDDVFAIQDEISAAIVGELKGHLKLDIGAAPKVSAGINTEAHDAALRGRYLLAQRKPGSKEGAAAEFEKALSFDPDFASAHAELAISLSLGGCGYVTDTQCLARARPHVEKHWPWIPPWPKRTPPVPGCRRIWVTPTRRACTSGARSKSTPTMPASMFGLSAMVSARASRKSLPPSRRQ
jgi:hypothetical protein